MARLPSGEIPEPADADELVHIVSSLEPRDVERLWREATLDVKPTPVQGASPIHWLFAARVRRLEDLAGAREGTRRAHGATRAEAIITHAQRRANLDRARSQAADAIDAARSRAVFADPRAAHGGAPGEDAEAREAAVRSMLDLAILARVAGAALPRTTYETLAGPWWRGAIAHATAAWGAAWNWLSLAGFWLTLAGVVATLIVGLVTGSQLVGPAANVVLAAMGGGVALWVVGLLISTAVPHARLIPVPTREEDRPNLAARIWRFPESAAEWLIGRR